MKIKSLLMLGLPLTLLAGCGASQLPAENAASTRTSQLHKDAPAGSAAVSENKTGADHRGSGAGAMTPHTHSTSLLFATTPAALPVGKIATWTLQINDKKSGAGVKDFTVVHDKLMHLIVVKKDLTWFNHLHPQFQGNGKFVVQIALPTAGDYKIYADYTPKGGAQEVPEHEFQVGNMTTPLAQLTPDKMKGVWMTKKVTAHPDGQPNGKAGATYQVALMPMPFPFVTGQDSMLHFQIRDASGKPLTDLQPYLGAMGHCVILSRDTTKYLHAHPMEGDGSDHDMSVMGDMKAAAPPKTSGPDVMFHTNFPTAGKYKAWGQFQHKGKIITASFVVDVKPVPAGATAATHDESQSHSH